MGWNSPYTIAEGAVRGEVYVSGGTGIPVKTYLEYFELPSGKSGMPGSMFLSGTMTAGTVSK